MLSDIATAARVYQWPKNLVVFAALIFGQLFTEPDQIARSIAAFAVFCVLSSAIYLFNDIIDAKSDRAHPEKCKRPVASGRIPASAAGIVAMILLGAGLLGGAALNWQFFGVVVGFIVLNTAYKPRQIIVRYWTRIRCRTSTR